MNTICLVIDRLHVGYLGPYGNAWIRTPAMNRLAAEGFTFDAAFLESPKLDHFCQSCWLGRHAMEPRGPVDLGRAIPALLSARSVATRLVTDDPTIAAHPLAGSFGEIIELHLPTPAGPAEEVEDTLLAQYFAQVLELLDASEGPFFQWCHVGALGTAWDAPLELRRMDWDEDDPEPPQTVTVPSKRLSDHYDPDELLGFSQVYAAQVCALDACIEVLHDWLQTSPIGRETLLVITSARGFPMGEHLRVGDFDESLYGELTHLPLILRFPDLRGASDRSHTLVQPSDLARTLAEWHGLTALEALGGRNLIPIVQGDSNSLRQCIGIVGEGDERVILTPAWYLRQTQRPELFSRPGDRWCANDAANRCAETVESLTKLLTEYHHSMQTGQINNFPPLASDLLIGPE